MEQAVEMQVWLQRPADHGGTVNRITWIEIGTRPPQGWHVHKNYPWTYRVRNEHGKYAYQAGGIAI